ncbi:MAG: hypothetical protein QXK06_04610, partial [Candidatus Diapherotrites archaeon]
MKRALLPALFIFCLMNASGGYFNYSIELQGKNAFFTTTIGLDSSTPANSFTVNNFSLPPNSILVSLRDSMGQIKKYSVSNDTLSFETNKGNLKTKETVQIKYKVEGIAFEDFAPLYAVELSLPGSQDSITTVEVKGETLISFESSQGFKGEISNGTLKLSGKGPVFISAFYSNAGIEFEHFFLFNKSSLAEKQLTENGLKQADNLFEILPRILGFNAPFKKIPVLVLSNQEYLQKINYYSEGVYRSGGIIVLKESAFEKNATAVILHESVHAFNAQAIKWNSSGTAWFDEGMAKFMESQAKKILGEKTPNLFYGDVSWTQGNYKFTLKPAGNIEDLFNYLKEKKQFMQE